MKEIWGVNSNDDIYHIVNGKWQTFPGKLKQISVGPNGEVWGVNSADDIFYMVNGNWQKVPGKLKQVSVGPNGEVWGVNSADDIFYMVNGNWQVFPGKLKHVSIGLAPNTLQNLNSQVSNLTNQLNNTNTQVLNLTNQLNTTNTQASDLTNQLNNANAQITNTTNQLNASNSLISNLTNQLNSANQQIQLLQQPPARKFYQLSLDQKTAIGTAVFLIGLMLAMEGKEIIEDEYKLTGKTLMMLCCIALVTILTKEMVDAKKEATAILISMRKRAGLLSDALTETVVNGANLLKAFEDATLNTSQVLVTLGNTTDKVIVQLKDEITGSLVQLRGDASNVANAIQKGINDGRFQPLAKVNAAVNVKADVNVNSKFSIF